MRSEARKLGELRGMLGKWISCSEHDQSWLSILSIHKGYVLRTSCGQQIVAPSFCGTMIDSVENADAGGESGSTVLRGDAAVVRERRAAGRAHSRVREAVQAELAKL